MNRLIPLALGTLLAAAAAADDVVIGDAGFPLNTPFCGT
jgi:hypothetical protein